MDGMLSVQRYADEHEMHADTVRKWCKNGNIPGAVKLPDAKSGAGFQYWIPMDAEPAKPKRKYTRRDEQANAKAEAEEQTPQQEPEPAPKLKTMREKAEFIRRNCINLSYGQLKQETGLSHMEIRRIYDRLHEVHGI